MMNAKEYKKIELEIRELVGQAREKWYDIATRCVKLLNESDSYAVAIGIKPDDVLSHLNGYLRDSAVNLEDVVTLLQVFPNREQWNRPLLDLLEDAEKQIRASAAVRQANEPDLPRTRQSVKVAEYQAVTAEVKEQQSELQKLRAENQRLIAANEKLTERVAKLEGQVTELRRAKREPVGV